MIYLKVRISDIALQWFQSSFAKIVLYVESEEELLTIKKNAEEAGIETHLITDSGKTEFHGIPTNTVVALGPDDSDKIDKVTGDLPML
tara:strand:+ start:778 stop:1041 length:264 start_codon:yes stop_codon:yes gene_type:complete